MRRVAIVSCVILSLALVAPALAQSSYDEELSQLSGTLRALMVRAERVQPKDHASRTTIQHELFDLSIKLHQLEEESMSANLELQRKSGAPDRQLLVAASIAKTLDLAQSLTGYFLDTRDKVFMSSPFTVAQTARTIQASC